MGLNSILRRNGPHLQNGRRFARLNSAEMRFGLTHALVLVLVAALLASVQCLANCAVTVCSAGQAHSEGCSHHEHSRDKQSGCPHRNSEFTCTPAVKAQPSTAKSVAVEPVLADGTAGVLIRPWLLSPLDTGSPPRSQPAATFSVLRI